MKLKLTTLNEKSRAERVILPSNLVGLFDEYLVFYQTKSGVDVKASNIIAEIIHTFIQADRDFMKYWREKQFVAKKIK